MRKNVLLLLVLVSICITGCTFITKLTESLDKGMVCVEEAHYRCGDDKMDQSNPYARTTYEYDENNLLVKEEQYYGSSEEKLSSITVREYDDSLNLVKETSTSSEDFLGIEEGDITEVFYQYDSNNNLLERSTTIGSKVWDTMYPVKQMII